MRRHETGEPWLYLYTGKSQCSPIFFNHWKAQFNTAIVQIASAQFKRPRLIIRTGADLYAQAQHAMSEGADLFAQAQHAMPEGTTSCGPAYGPPIPSSSR